MRWARLLSYVCWLGCAQSEPDALQSVEKSADAPVAVAAKPPTQVTELVSADTAAWQRAALQRDLPTLSPPSRKLDASAFTILSSAGVTLRPHALVVGDVGALSSTESQIALWQHARVDGDVHAEQVTLKHFAQVDVAYTSILQNTGGQVSQTRPVQRIDTPFSFVPIGSGGETDIVVAQHQTRSLPPGAYRLIEVRAHGVLTLEAGVYSVDTLQVLQHGTLRAAGPVVMAVGGELRVGPHGQVSAPKASALKIFSAGASVSFEHHARFTGLFSGSGTSAWFAPHTVIRGAFLVAATEVGEHADVRFESGFGCEALTCANISQCGVHSDGCGGLVDCGACSEPQSECFGFDLTASAARNTTAFAVDAESLTEPMSFHIPPRIGVLQGSVVGAVAALTFLTDTGQTEECYYSAPHAQAADLQFDRCAHGRMAGDLARADVFRLELLTSTIQMMTISVRLNAEPCGCEPVSCAVLQASCGVLTDGCGGLVSCGGCTEPLTCGADADLGYTCSCVPRSCSDADASCGEIDDGCGGTVTCGVCAAGERCSDAHTCECVKRTCQQEFATCGFIDDGCGSITPCGECNDLKPAVVAVRVANVAARRSVVTPRLGYAAQ